MKTRNINTYNPNIEFELSRISNPMVRTHNITILRVTHHG